MSQSHSAGSALASLADIGVCPPRGMWPAHRQPHTPIHISSSSPQECFACVPWDGDTAEPEAGMSGASPSPTAEQLEASS